MAFTIDRRGFAGLAGLAAGSAAIPAFLARRVLAQDKLAVAGIWTVPVEQQWVSRLHLALQAALERGEIDYVWSENTANTDYERVMREYAEAGKALILGEAFGVEAGARTVATDYPETAFLLGSSVMPQEPNFSVFDNFIEEASYLTGIVAGRMMLMPFAPPTNSQLTITVCKASASASVAIEKNTPFSRSVK